MLNLFERLLTTKYLIQINYKSGISMKFWTYSFEINNGSITWESVYQRGKKPLLIGVDNIESVYIIKTRKGLYRK